jgi:hypothetical protein
MAIRAIPRNTAAYAVCANCAVRAAPRRQLASQFGVIALVQNFGRPRTTLPVGNAGVTANFLPSPWDFLD